MIDTKSDIEVKESSIEGLGVFALRDFKENERVVEWNRTELTEEQYKLLSEDERNRYVSYNGGKYLLSGKPMRYVNHSCNPNTKPQNDADVAVRDIKIGEEITSDYRDEGVICNCGTEKCKSQGNACRKGS